MVCSFHRKGLCSGRFYPIKTFDESNAKDPLSETLGRTEAWDTLHQYVTTPAAKIMYLWGPPGTGKTFLIDQFRAYCHSFGHVIVGSSCRELDELGLPWWQHLAEEFGLSPTTAAIADIEHAMLERCQATPFIWIIEDCDAPEIDRAWIVQLALKLRHYGSSIVLTGRSSPFQLWSGQLELQHHMQFVELGDWDPPLVRRILTARGITDLNVIEQAIRLTHGRPKLVSAISDGLFWLRDNQVPATHRAFMADAMDLSGFLIEQMCHPGSRRLMWHGGQPGDDVDTLIAAAAVVPVFNRDWMTHMVGRAVVMSGWDRFITQPLVNSYLGGYYGLFPELRREIMTTVHKVRPWMWEHWTRQTADYYFSQISTGRVAKQNAWGSLSGLIRTNLGPPVFAPPMDTVPWEVHWETTSDRSQGGRVGHIVDSSGERVAQATFTVEDLHTLHVADVTSHSLDRATLLGLVSTLASTFYLYDTIIWHQPTSDAETELLKILQFTPNNGAWHLDLHDDQFMAWMASLIRPPNGRRPNNPIRIVQDALQSLREGKEHYGTEATEFWTSISPDGNFRGWFLDALNSANLGERIEGKSLLVLYYLDRRGTHEELAEMLHVSRATYFRNHRLAIERLAQAVFD